MSATPYDNGTPASETPRPDRYAFNMPPGSVRGLLVIMIMVPFWILLAWPERLAPMPFYLYFLLGWVFLFLFSPVWSISPEEASTDQPAEFHLPRYTIHILLFVVTVGLLGWRLYSDPSGQDLIDRLSPDPDQVRRLPLLLLSLFAGFLPGWLLTQMLGKWRDVYWFQDIQASVSLIAMLGLAALTIIHLVNASLLKEVNTDMAEYILIGVVAWYFGARAPAAYPKRVRRAA
jgi:hypothetical protein